MSQLKIVIGTDNSAFTDGSLGIETARILREAADRLEQLPVNEVEFLGMTETNGIRLMDMNGNHIGQITHSV